MWQLATMTKSSIDIENQWFPTLTREYDHILMTMATQYNLMTVQLQNMNRCWIHLLDLTIADITTPDGLHILPLACAGHKEPH